MNKLAYRLAHAKLVTHDEEEVKKCLTEIKEKCFERFPLGQEFHCDQTSCYATELWSPCIVFVDVLEKEGFIVQSKPPGSTTLDFSLWINIVISNQITSHILDQIDKKLERLKRELVDEYFKPDGKGCEEAKNEFNKLSKTL